METTFFLDVNSLEKFTLAYEKDILKALQFSFNHYGLIKSRTSEETPCHFTITHPCDVSGCGS